jgi:diaminohydroxyphosphoribosylaminopyrimidine deaminase/5-amino-6-(5-phosphoribosylamino)uracil reductase
MRRCLELAGLGLGNVSPNPMVGCVIVHEGKIIGEGWHQGAGEAHAEVNAIASVKNRELLKDSTLYVSLEPCAHFGKTPPCSDLIIEMKIPEVIVAMQDPFSKVDGAGIERLRKAGVNVEVDVLKEEARRLNRRFIRFHEDRRPYIILKWAQSSDGYLAPKEHKGIHWISHPDTKQLTHRWRSEEDAILIGKGTLLKDDPKLTTRAYPGKDPLRIILGSDFRSLEHSTIWKDEKPALFFTGEGNEEMETNELVDVSGRDLQAVLHELYNRQIQSIIVEGGAHILNAFIREGLWDEARVILGSEELTEGVQAPLLEGNAEESLFGPDLIRVYSA